MSKKFPNSTKVVVIGGGVIGCSVAYHLTKFGWKDVVVLERDQLTSGTTWHAAGLVSQLGPTAAVTKIRKRSRSFGWFKIKRCTFNCSNRWTLART